MMKNEILFLPSKMLAVEAAFSKEGLFFLFSNMLYFLKALKTLLVMTD